MPADGDREGLNLIGCERLLVQHILQKAAQCLCFKHISTNFAKDRKHFYAHNKWLTIDG